MKNIISTVYILVVPVVVVFAIFNNHSHYIATAQTTTTDTLATQVIARSDNVTTDATTSATYSLTIFRDALLHTNLLESVLGNISGIYTVFAPTDQAMMDSSLMQMYLRGSNGTTTDGTPIVPVWNQHLLAVLRHHIVPDFIYNNTELFDQQRVEIMSFHETLNISPILGEIQGSTLFVSDIVASNGILHVVNKVLPPKFMTQSFSQLELQSEYGPDHLQRTAMTDVVDLNNARSVLDTIQDDGLTFVGCRIRAFNRLEEYLPQAINGSPLGVIQGEFLNTSNTNQTIHDFIQYSMIPKNYYNLDLPNGFVELTIPIPNCGHMWVTKRNDLLCFNNGCVVETPDPRQFLASNGMGYVIDKCQVCPGVAMLTNFAAEYSTQYNLKETAQFFGASEWNIRDLRLSVGDGTDVTLFAAITTGWSFFNLEDMTRLAGDEWKPHQLDMLAHMLVQGAYTRDDLKVRYETEGGPYNLTTLANQTLEVVYDSTKDLLTVNGADVIFGDVQGVDGYVHFITRVPLPRSVTHTVYDIAKEDPEYATHISYIDTVRLDSDMKRLSPLTTFWAPNSAFEGKITRMDEIAEVVLENHIFETLIWCDAIIALNGTTITSFNNISWTVSIGSSGLPCFDTYAVEGGTMKQTCITKCDILARNGIVHQLDDILLYTAAETRPPSAVVNGSPSTGGASQPAAPSVFQRPSDSSLSNAAPEASPSGDDVSFGAGEQSNAFIGQSSSLVSTIVVVMASMISMTIMDAFHI